MFVADKGSSGDGSFGSLEDHCLAVMCGWAVEGLVARSPIGMTRHSWRRVTGEGVAFRLSGVVHDRSSGDRLEGIQ